MSAIADNQRLEFVHFDHVKHGIVIEKEACLTGTRSNALKGRSISAYQPRVRRNALQPWV